MQKTGIGSGVLMHNTATLYSCDPLRLRSVSSLGDWSAEDIEFLETAQLYFWSDWTCGWAICWQGCD